MTIFGWDMSHYDTVNSDTAERVIAEGFSFVTHKVGGDANDAEIRTFWNEFKDHRDALLIGGYWVLRPDTSGSIVSKANAFCDRLDSLCPGWGDTPFILQVDCERWNSDTATIPNKSEIQQFCARLRVRAPKLMPIVYGPEWVYGNNLGGLGYPLWASRYVADSSGTAYGMYPGDDSAKWAAYSGQVPEILQFTSSATIAGQSTSDANAYRGTLAELTTLLAPGWEVDMAITDDDITRMWSIDGLIANAPGATDITTNPEIAPRTALQRIYDLTQRMYNAAPATTAQINALTAVVQALATGDLTEDEIKDAVKTALREGTGGTV